MHYRLFIASVVLVMLAGSVAGQSVNVFGLKVVPWPDMQAQLLVTNTAGAPIRPSIADVQVWEEGAAVSNLRLTCPQTSWKQPAAVALSLDISNSMSRDIPPEVMALARRFSKSFVDRLTMPPSDVALQVCDDAARLLVDFTSNAQRLKDVISTIVPRGGNDFTLHLLDPDAGLLPIATRGTHQRSAVLVTDAFWEELPAADLQRALAACASNNIRFYAVVMTERSLSSTGIVKSLREIAQASGGGVFEGIITDSIADALAASLATAVEGSEPCVLSWDATPLCPAAEKRLITVGVRGVDTVTVDYAPQWFEKKKLIASPDVVRFSTLPVGASSSATVRITAQRSSATIVSAYSPDPAFTVAPSSFTLVEGGFIDLTVTYTSDGRSLIGTRLRLVDPSCEWEVPAIRVSRSVSPGAFDIDVADPNGKEVIRAGTDTVISWTSGDTTLPVDVDVTIDYGASWIPVARGVIGTQTKWAPVPRVESDRCLARVTSISPPLPDSLLAFAYECSAIDVMKEDASSAWGGSIAIGTAYGFLARGSRGYSRIDTVWQAHTDTICDVVGDPTNASRILTGSVDGTCALHDNVQTLRSMNHGSPVRAVQFSGRGSTCYSTGDDGRIVEWDYSSGNQQRVVTALGSPVIAMRCVGPDTIVVVTSDGRTRSIRASDGTVYWQIVNGPDAIRCIDVHHLHHKIAVGTTIGTVYTLNPADGTASTIPLQVSTTNSPIIDVTFGNDNPNISLVLATCANGETFSTVPATSSITPLQHYSRPGRCVARYDDVIAVGWSGSITTSFVSPDPLSSAFVNDVDVIVNASLDRAASRLVTVSEGGWVWIWDVGARRPEQVFRVVRIDPQIPPALSPSGQYLVVANDNATLVCYDLEDARAMPYTSTIGGGVSTLKFDPVDDATLGVGTGVGVTRVSVPSLIEGITYPSSFGEVIDFAWSPDGTLLAIVEPNASIRTIDIVTGTVPPPIPVNNITDRSITGIAWHPNGRQLYAASGNNLSLVDVPSRSVTLQVGLDAPANEVSVSPLGTQVVLVQENRSDPIQIFDAISLTTLVNLGSSLGSKYAPSHGRFAGATPIHVSSSLLGAGVIRSLGPSGPTTITDESDTLFSIVWPRVQTSDVDMGRVRLTNRKDSTITDLVRNTTKFLLRADSLRIIGANASDFRISLENVPGRFSAPSTSRGEITFNPSAVGLRAAVCEIFVGRDTARVGLAGVGVLPSLAIETPRIDMGTHLIGEVFDSAVVVLRSVSPTPTQITSMCLLNNPVMPFRVVESLATTCATPYVVAPGDSVRLVLRFAPSLIGRSSTLLEVQTDDGLGTYNVTVLGTGIGPIIGVRSDSGYPGDRRPFTLEMRGVNGPLQGGATLSFEADLSFDASVVVPLSGERKANGSVTMRGVWNSVDSIIGTLPATIVLGRTDSSTVSITRFVWYDEQGAPLNRDLRLEGGVYRVLGICDESGKRLFEPGTQGAGVRVSESGIVVNVLLRRDDDVKIEVLTMQGRTVTQQRERGRSGQLAVQIDLTDVARGVYMVRVTTSSMMKTILTSW
ncbi:MAG: choice-of-anchor D domain-containing protein [Candidatus Kapabacteria bacterium]|nr:choice-of-anchor D domain-containing protein [Candidatus Kapabacteria bacterium]